VVDIADPDTGTVRPRRAVDRADGALDPAWTKTTLVRTGS
jgi:hypothetical protein